VLSGPVGADRPHKRPQTPPTRTHKHHATWWGGRGSASCCAGTARGGPLGPQLALAAPLAAVAWPVGGSEPSGGLAEAQGFAEDPLPPRRTPALPRRSRPLQDGEANPLDQYEPVEDEEMEVSCRTLVCSALCLALYARRGPHSHQRSAGAFTLAPALPYQSLTPPCFTLRPVRRRRARTSWRIWSGEGPNRLCSAQAPSRPPALPASSASATHHTHDSHSHLAVLPHHPAVAPASQCCAAAAGHLTTRHRAPP
jgi:hypothetical protein